MTLLKQLRVRIPSSLPENAFLVQSVERWTVNPCVTGSSPVGSAKDSRLAEFWLNALPSVELILILQCINYMP